MRGAEPRNLPGKGLPSCSKGLDQQVGSQGCGGRQAGEGEKKGEKGERETSHGATGTHPAVQSNPLSLCLWKDSGLLGYSQEFQPFVVGLQTPEFIS